MKFLERGLILLALIGYYLAVWNKPSDPGILLIAVAGLAGLHLFGMPFLLRQRGSQRPSIPDLLLMVAFGGVSAYCIFSLAYHSLGNMTSLALVENSTLLLLPVIAVAWWRAARTGKPAFRELLVRGLVLAAFILVSLVLNRLHPPAAARLF